MGENNQHVCILMILSCTTEGKINDAREREENSLSVHEKAGRNRIWCINGGVGLIESMDGQSIKIEESRADRLRYSGVELLVWFSQWKSVSQVIILEQGRRRRHCGFEVRGGNCESHLDSREWVHEVAGDLYMVSGHLWGPSQPHWCIFFSRHSQLRCSTGRVGFGHGWAFARIVWRKEREGQGHYLCVQGGDSMETKLGRKGNEDTKEWRPVKRW